MLLLEPDPPQSANPAQSQRVLLLELKRERYALSLDAVAGLGEPGPIRKVHGAPRAVLGLVEWRGRLLTVVDLPRLVDDEGCPGAPCIVRLGTPLDNLALYVPGSVKLAPAPLPAKPFARTLAAAPHDPAPLLEHAGQRLRLIDPARLMLRVHSAAEL